MGSCVWHRLLSLPKHSEQPAARFGVILFVPLACKTIQACTFNACSDTHWTFPAVTRRNEEECHALLRIMAKHLLSHHASGKICTHMTTIVSPGELVSEVSELLSWASQLFSLQCRLRRADEQARTRRQCSSQSISPWASDCWTLLHHPLGRGWSWIQSPGAGCGRYAVRVLSWFLLERLAASFFGIGTNMGMSLDTNMGMSLDTLSTSR